MKLFFIDTDLLLNFGVCMEELSLTTPALLFSAISLIMLAYTNRFLAYAAVIRNLHAVYLDKKDESLLRQIKNLKLRLTLTR